MHLAVILAILAALTAAERTPPQATNHPQMQTAGILALLASAALIATLGSVTIARGLAHDRHRRRWWMHCFRRLKQFYWTLWIVVTALILYAFDWPQIVYHNWSLDRFVLADDLVLILPVLLPLPIGWLAFYQVERTLQRLAHEAGIDSQSTNATAYLLLHARHYLGLILLPILTLLAAQDVADWWWPGWEQKYGLLLYVPVLLALLLGLPFALRHIWTTRRLADGSLRDRLLAALAIHRVAVRELLVWETQGRMLNAAVTGLCGPLRYVLLTDVLLEKLPDDELEAVLLHEVGHVRRHHFLLRILLLFLPLWWWLALMHLQSGPGGISTTLAAWLSNGPNELVLPVVVGSYALFALGGYARWLEYDADLWSCLHHPDGLQRGARLFATALLRIADFQQEKRGSWLHPSSRNRAAFILQSARDEQFVHRFRRRLRCFHACLLAAVLLPLLLAVAAHF